MVTPVPPRKPSLEYWPQLLWSALSTRDFSERAASPLMARTVAVLPLGATEQHGPHLPTGVDTIITRGIVQAVLEQLTRQPPAQRPPVLFLPTQAIGFSPEHSDFAGTLTLSAATVLALWSEIGACVAAAGVRRLLLFNSHGGHIAPMDMAARQLRQQHGLLTYSCSWFHLPQPQELAQRQSAWEQRFGVHAGEQETSIMLYLEPALVEMAHARTFLSSAAHRARDYPVLGNGRSAKMGWMMRDYNHQGAAGNAAGASAELGQALVANAAGQLLTVLQEISSLPLPQQPPA